MKTFKNFNEGVLDLLTKKGREKRAGERDEKKKAQAKKDQEDKDFDEVDFALLKESVSESKQANSNLSANSEVVFSAV